MSLKNIELMQSLIAGFFGIVLFLSLNFKFATQINKYSLVFLVGGVLVAIFSGKIKEALKATSDRVQDVFLSIGFFGIFVGSQNYVMPLIQKNVWIVALISVAGIIFADWIAGLMVKK